MKQELLEYLIRHCVKEVLTQINEEDETVGAAAPPADGQGTADQPEIPKDTPSDKPVTPESNLKGIVFVNPKDKAKLQPVDFNTGNDNPRTNLALNLDKKGQPAPVKVDTKNLTTKQIESSLHRLAHKFVGSKAKVSLATIRLVSDSLKNPNATLYLYLGKFDPSSDEIFLMSDKDLNTAKDDSVSTDELVGGDPTALAPQTFSPMNADANEFSKRMDAQGKTEPTKIDESLRREIRKTVSKILSR